MTVGCAVGASLAVMTVGCAVGAASVPVLGGNSAMTCGGGTGRSGASVRKVSADGVLSSGCREQTLHMATDPADTLRTRRRLVSDWGELCRWDPALPPDSHPPLADAVVEGLLEALERPQPLAWGDDATFAAAIDRFHRACPDLEVAIAQLVCLRAAVHRSRRHADRDAELHARADMLIDRGILQSVKLGVHDLKDQALLDELTGLANRRALDLDLPAELSRAGRYGRTVAVVAIDLDGLKQINDAYGHSAGDEAITSLAGSIQRSLREQDRAYRIGGDEFVVVLPETDAAAADQVMRRVVDASAPSFTWGAVATDGSAPPRVVLDEADRILIGNKHRSEAGR